MRLFRRLHIPDLHAPLHSDKAFRVMLEVAKDFKPDEIVIYGDFYDTYSLSFHERNPEKNFLTFEHEMELARPCMEKVRAINPKANLVFLCGNHEDRVNRYIRAYAPMLARNLSLEKILSLPRGTKFYPYGQKNKHFMGKLMATHGTLFNQHVAQAMVRKYGMSVSFGHVHRAQEHNVKTVHGERLKGISFGWLGDIESAGEYVKDLADWVHGFGLSYHFPNGEFVWQTIEIQNGKAVFDGKIY